MAKKKAEPKKRIFLVEDHEVLRQGLRLFIGQESDMEVCGEAGNAVDALTAITALHPDAVVTDISMPGMNGIEATTDCFVEGQARPNDTGYIPPRLQAQHESLTARRLEQAGQHAQGRSFSRAVRAEQPVDLTGKDRQREIVNRVHVTE